MIHGLMLWLPALLWPWYWIPISPSIAKPDPVSGPYRCLALTCCMTICPRLYLLWCCCVLAEAGGGMDLSRELKWPWWERALIVAATLFSPCGLANVGEKPADLES